MSLSKYNVAIEPTKKALRNLRAILEKAVQYVEENGISEGVVESTRLFPDMMPLTKQVQIATDLTKGCAGRLTNSEIPSFEDNETTFAELLARIDKTLAYVDQFTPEDVDEANVENVHLKLPRKSLDLTVDEYINQFVLPNVYFHVSTTYAILRSCGLALSKIDYLGSVGGGKS